MLESIIFNKDKLCPKVHANPALSHELRNIVNNTNLIKLIMHAQSIKCAQNKYLTILRAFTSAAKFARIEHLVI